MCLEKKIKHLEFIQNVITRIGNNSFLIKGWAITLVSASFALSAKDANVEFSFIPYISVPLFWILDGYYLSIERQYRGLYNTVSLKEEANIDFSMDISSFNIGANKWLNSIFSWTLTVFYFVFFILTILISTFVNEL